MKKGKINEKSRQSQVEPKTGLTITYPPKLRPRAKSEGENTGRRAEVESGAAGLHQAENRTFCCRRQLDLLLQLE